MPVEETTYKAPQEYQNAHNGAPEASDLRYLHASAAVIRFGGLPVVALENLNISQQVNKSPINVVGALAALGFDTQGISVNVSGQIVQLALMSLNGSSFYPKNEVDIIASINRVFNIDVVMMDYTKLEPADIPTEPFITVRNCQNTGSNIVINSNTNMKDSFTCVGTIMERDWDELAEFNKLISA